jgi:error-prone DNA polymerase
MICLKSAALLKDGSAAAAYNHGQWVRVAGAVIARQRPSTAKGFVFLSLEDETGISNIVVRPPMFQKFRLLWTSEPFILVPRWCRSRTG